jgi:hypothetical protein
LAVPLLHDVGDYWLVYWGLAMKRWKVWWAVAALTVLVVFIAVVYPHLHSSRLDALEPYMRAGVSLDEIQQVADKHSIPLEPLESDKSQVLRFRVPLDGSRSGETLYLEFQKDFSWPSPDTKPSPDTNVKSFGLIGSSVSDRNGKTVRQWFCVLR